MSLKMTDFVSCLHEPMVKITNIFLQCSKISPTLLDFESGKVRPLHAWEGSGVIFGKQNNVILCCYMLMHTFTHKHTVHTHTHMHTVHVHTHTRIHTYTRIHTHITSSFLYDVVPPPSFLQIQHPYKHSFSTHNYNHNYGW